MYESPVYKTSGRVQRLMPKCAALPPEPPASPAVRAWFSTRQISMPAAVPALSHAGSSAAASRIASWAASEPIIATFESSKAAPVSIGVVAMFLLFVGREVRRLWGEWACCTCDSHHRSLP